MRWTVAEARQRFSELLRMTSESPQSIFLRNRPVAAVVDLKTFEEFQAWRNRQQAVTIADAFEELRRIEKHEAYTLRTRPRVNRSNPFTEVVDEFPS